MKMRLTIIALFISLLCSVSISKANNPIFENVMNLPTTQVGFADSKTKERFKNRFNRLDYAQKIIDLANLRWADSNADQCLTANEYKMFLVADKIWKKSSKKMRENQLKAFFSDYWLGSFFEGNKVEYVNEVKKLEERLHGKMLYLLWNSVVKGKWSGADKIYSMDEVRYFTDSWNTFLTMPRAEIHKYLNQQMQTIKECKTLPGPMLGPEVLNPVEKAKDIATIIESKMDSFTEIGMWAGKVGAAGFFGALYGKTKDRKYFEISKSMFLDVEKKYLSNKPDFTLLDGTTGIGLSALFAYRMSGEKTYLKIAERFGDLTKLNDGNDHATGAAGIGIFKLNLYTITKNKKWLDEARAAGDLLIERAVTKNNQAWWIQEKVFPAVFAGFGHGSAGIGYFLIHLYNFTGIEIYKTYAEKAANHVVKTAYHDENGNFHWTHYQPAMGYATAWKYQWSHGNFGIAYFFSSLKQITPKEKWDRAFDHTMAPALEKGIEYRYDEGGMCCGKAGQGDLYLTLYRETKDPRYLELAKTAARYLVDENGKVKESFGRKENKYDMSYSGLAGIGLYFLQLDDPLASDLAYHIYRH